MGQTTAASVPGPILPLMRSYNVIDQNPLTLRWTEFYDAEINIKRDDTPNGPASPRDRDRHALCPEWRAAVVGRKRVGSESWGLYTELNNLLIPLFARVIRVSIDQVPLRTEFRTITASYDGTGTRTGYFISGIVHRQSAALGRKRYLLVMRTRGCLSLNGAPLTLDWHRLYEIQDRQVENIKSSQQLSNGNYVVVVENRRPVDPEGAHGSLLTLDYNNGNVVGSYSTPANLLTSLNDAIEVPTQSNSVPKLLTVGQKILTNPADKLGYFASGIPSTQSNLECDFVAAPFVEISHDISDEPRLILSFPEPVVAVEVVRVELELEASASCAPSYSCSVPPNEDRIHQWSSHYDRGNDIAILANNDLIATGLIAGTYTLPKSTTPSIGCADCSRAPNYLNSRNMDCFMLLTDSHTDVSQSRHGWFQLLLQPEDVTISCTGNVPLLADRGSSGFELGYGVSAGEGIASIVGMQILTRPTSSSPCPYEYPGGRSFDNSLGGDRNAFIPEVYDLGTSTPKITSLLFGKRHNYLTDGADFFRSIEDNYDLYAFDEPGLDATDATIYISARAAAVNAEVFFDVVRDENPSSIDEAMSVSVGFTSSTEFVTNNVGGLVAAPIHKRGLAVGTAALYGKSNCAELSTKKLWATCVGVLPQSQLEKSLGFGGVAKAVNTDGTSAFTAVGYTQHNGYVSNTMLSVGGPKGTWQGESGNQGLTGVIIQFDEDGSVTNTARIAISNTSCPQESNAEPYVGIVRLQEIASQDADGDGITDCYVVVGSIMLSNVNENSDDITEREHMFVAKVDNRLNMVWSRILVADIPYPLAPSKYNGKLRSVTTTVNNRFVVAGEAAGIEVGGAEPVQSYVVTIELDSDGRTISSRQQLRPLANGVSGRVCGEELEESTHLGGIAHRGDVTAMIGHTCRFE